MSAPAPAFALDKIRVLFVLGGPGSGKGTQCAKLVASHSFVHLSAGELLRAEQARPESPHIDAVTECLMEGKPAPLQLIIDLVKGAMLEAAEERQGEHVTFLIDGFPRTMDQATTFEQMICEAALVLFLDCDVDAMVERLTKRASIERRDDDNPETIKKRLDTFKNTSLPVVTHYRQKGKVVDIDSAQPVDVVHASILQALAAIV